MHSISGISEVLREFRGWRVLDMNTAKSELFFGGYSDEGKLDLSNFDHGREFSY